MKDEIKKIKSSRTLRKVLICASVIFLYYLTCMYHLEPNEIGISWNPISGESKCDTVAGIHVAVPWEMVSVIDIRPMRICITSTANSYSCQLVTFDKRYWRDFVKAQGFNYWWWNNRLSINMGYKDEYRGFKDVLRGYAYGNRKYRFIRVMEDYSTQ